MNTIDILKNGQTVQKTIFDLPEAGEGESNLEFRFVSPVYIAPQNGTTARARRELSLGFRFVSPVNISPLNGDPTPAPRESKLEFRFVSPVSISLK